MILTTPAIMPLDSMGFIKVDGPDAKQFLQDQLTADLDAVTPQQAQLSTYTNPKGRCYALMTIILFEGAYYLWLKRTAIGLCLEALTHYALFSKVTLTEASNEMGCFGLCTDAMALEAHQVRQDTGFAIMGIPGIQPRNAVFGLAAPVQEQWDQWASTLDRHPEAAWICLDIFSGLPHLEPATQLVFVPQRLNLHRLGAVSFTKGCYLGQEIIARLQHRGQLKHEMLHYQVSGPVTANQTLSTQAGQAIGQVVNAITYENEHHALIVMLKTQIDTKEAWVEGEQISLAGMTL